MALLHRLTALLGAGVILASGVQLKSNTFNVGIELGNYHMEDHNYLFGALKMGYYFLIFPNKYNITNEIFIDGVQTVGSDLFNQFDIGFNWVTNFNNPFNAFVGVRTGLIYWDGDTGHTWGFQGGILYSFNRKQQLEVGVSWDHIYSGSKTDEWGNSVIRVYAGYSFMG
ncbi:MAG: hypothetical protein C6I01_05970, partial [Epsilonproteobacteria bacterium]|nr:hypothetical protein [Campylobacterota bacterium]NPA89653.1 hypothetical protein [Campylobacterota bacterium]